MQTFSRVVLLLVMWATLQARADVLADFRTFMNATQSGRSEFVQTVTDAKGRETQKAKGTFVFVRPGKFHFHYEQPAQEIIGDGVKVWLYDRDLAQVTVRKFEKSFSSTPAAILAGKSDIEASFTLVAGGEQDGLQWLNAEPKSKDAGIEKIRLGFSANQLAAMELIDAFGNRTRMQFQKFDRNPRIDPKEFTFTAPKGVDVVSE
ncbi:MAG: outer membrane lipoprotein chaperone LolA [Betaproteobacteria bacterium]|nr:outer membrane lipoprotein chaperone LolA [Betaproteobacteria bacterium]